MKVLMVILKHVNLTGKIIQNLAEAGVKGGTILDATGMGKSLLDMEDLPMFGMLRHLIEDADREEAKLMIFVLKEEEEDQVRNIIKKVIGDFNKPNTGIMFSMPITDVEGLGD